MNANNKQHRAILGRIADKAMLDWDLQPGFSAAALSELARLSGPASGSGDSVRDLRDLLWCSIDNDDSRDLDQLTVAEALPDNTVKVLVAVADVDSLIKEGSAINEHAQQNTTSVYTAARIYPMLPERLSTDLTSLNFDEDRLAVVIEMMVGADGTVLDSNVYRGLVRNKAKLVVSGNTGAVTLGILDPSGRGVAVLEEDGLDAAGADVDARGEGCHGDSPGVRPSSPPRAGRRRPRRAPRCRWSRG